MYYKGFAKIICINTATFVCVRYGATLDCSYLCDVVHISGRIVISYIFKLVEIGSIYLEEVALLLSGKSDNI